MFSIKQNECVGFDSIWKVKRVYAATSAQTSDVSTRENGTDTELSRTIEIQTDAESTPVFCDVDMNKLSDWLQKVYPRVSRELNESINSNAFKNYRLAVNTEKPVVRILQTVKLQDDGNGDEEWKVSTLSWNCTGNTLAVACNQFHKTWCYHPGAVLLYTFDRYGKMPEVPTKRLPTEACVNITSFHPRLPSMIAAGTQSGDIIIWNIQYDDGDNVICRISAHEELITHMAWINDLDVGKPPLLATSSTDGCLALWNFNNVAGSIMIRHKYQVKPPVLSKLQSPRVSEEISKKVVRGIVAFNFSPYTPEIFIVGAEGGLVIQCSLLGTVPLKGSSNDTPLSDPVCKYYDSHEGEITKVLFSPNRKEMFLTCATDGEIRMYILDKDEPCKVIFLENPSLSLSWIPFHEKILVSCGSKGALEIFKLVTGEAVDLTIKDHVESVVLTQIALNNKRMGTVAVVTENGLMQIWTVPWNLYNCMC